MGDKQNGRIRDGKVTDPYNLIGRRLDIAPGGGTGGHTECSRQTSESEAIEHEIPSAHFMFLEIFLFRLIGRRIFLRGLSHSIFL